MLVDVADGREVGIEVEPYRNGVIDARLPAPDEDVVLGPDWALQDPDDYLETFRGAVRRLVAGSGVDPAQVIGIGIDFTACTMLPTTSDGTPLCFLDAYRRDPHAWVKLWKHHAAQPEADDINRVARELDQPWLDALRRQDLVRVVLPEGAPDPARGARRLPRRRPARRGGRLGRLATDRARDAEQLHGRLQGALVGRRRVPGIRDSSRRSNPASARSSTTRCRGRSCRSAVGPAA